MKILPVLLAGSLLGAGATFTAQHLFAQEPAQEPGPDMSPEAQMELMQAMMKMGAPGEEHKAMKSWVGNWNAEMKMRMSPEADWETYKGKAKIQSALGGRYMIEKFEANLGPMMGEMEGLLIFGYNNLTKQYESSWRDNWSTWASTATGFQNEEGMYEMSGLMKDLVTPEGRHTHYTTGFVTEDHMVMHMYDTIPPHGDVKVMQIDYYRVKE